MTCEEDMRKYWNFHRCNTLWGPLHVAPPLVYKNTCIDNVPKVIFLILLHTDGHQFCKEAFFFFSRNTIPLLGANLLLCANNWADNSRKLILPDAWLGASKLASEVGQKCLLWAKTQRFWSPSSNENRENMHELFQVSMRAATFETRASLPHQDQTFLWQQWRY